jgi:carbon monoxide dehydrogenase subunit G
VNFLCKFVTPKPKVYIMKALKIIGIILAAIIVIVLAVVFMQPAKGHVEKSVTINAPASAIFPHMNDLKKFVVWSPWSKMDPTAKQTFEGAAAGVGAKMAWDGPVTKTGTQWIVESVENERVKTGLAFGGESGTTWAEFKLIPEGNGTKVVWTFDGDNKGFSGRAMWIVMSPMLGSQFEDGLKDLKTLVESTPAQAPTLETAPADSTVTK